MATKGIDIYRVRAVDSAHIFYGDESPALRGTPYRLNPGQDPIEVPTDLAEYFNAFPGLRVDVVFGVKQTATPAPTFVPDPDPIKED
jgi:hypothetical protein